MVGKPMFGANAKPPYYTLGNPMGLFLVVCFVGGIHIHLRNRMKTLFLINRVNMG